MIRNQNINLPSVLELDATRVASIPGAGDVSAQVQAVLDTAAAAAGTNGVATVVFPARTYLLESTIRHPANVYVRGVGRGTVFQQGAGATPLWSFATGVVRGGLYNCRLLGQADGVTANRVGTGVSISESLFVEVANVEVWDFAIGVDLSDGTPYSAYNTVGPEVEINRCTTGIRALANCNATRIVGSRVFFSYGNANEGIGLDVDDASALTVEGNAFDGADRCIRVRSSGGQALQAIMLGNYWEPGTNPATSVVGLAYDIVLPTTGDDVAQIHGFANHTSANRGTAQIPPSSLHTWDGYSRAFFGARYNGAAQARRNFVRNGQILYYNAATIPEWFTSGAPVIAQNQVTFVTGNRSLQATATATNSTLSVQFPYPDEVEWITVGVRYQVVTGTGFQITARSGANLAQYTDPTPSGGQWQIAYVQVRRDPAATLGAVDLLIDSVAGTGQILVDEVWAYSGRYAAESTLYGERIEMLQAPITVLSGTGTGNLAVGPVNILDLPNVLGAPLNDFSTAPRGVVGGIYRARLAITGAPAGVMTNFHYLSLNIPAASTVVPATGQRVMAVYGGGQLHEQTIMIRSTSVSGVLIMGDGYAWDYSISLIGWILS